MVRERNPTPLHSSGHSGHNSHQTDRFQVNPTFLPSDPLPARRRSANSSSSGSHTERSPDSGTVRSGQVSASSNKPALPDRTTSAMGMLTLHGRWAPGTEAGR